MWLFPLLWVHNALIIFVDQWSIDGLRMTFMVGLGFDGRNSVSLTLHLVSELLTNNHTSILVS